MRPEITTIVLAVLAIAFGMQFVIVRVIPSLAFPVLAGWLVHVFAKE
jgi:uncharacterized membrane protein YraQ (UPF0718 family)